LEKGIQKLDLETDSFLSKLDENSEEVPSISVDCGTNTSKATISFKVPPVMKGPKNK
jgi:hypothetical protein